MILPMEAAWSFMVETAGMRGGGGIVLDERAILQKSAAGQEWRSPRHAGQPDILPYSKGNGRLVISNRVESNRLQEVGKVHRNCAGRRGSGVLSQVKPGRQIADNHCKIQTITLRRLP